MRRILILALVAAATLAPSVSAFAQQRRGGEQDEQADAQRRRQRAQEFEDIQAPLPGQAAQGPCPYVKVLYDAARYVEFKDNREASSNVGYTGEIEGISAACAYKGSDPIQVNMMITFSLGRGPQAPSAQKDYVYWVAVTTRNKDVLAKEYFTLPAKFAAGKNTLVISDHIAGVTIPRADDKVSGNNFEVLVGFDITPQMAEFNRDGKRFRVDAVPAPTAAAGTPPAR
jgi:hypothetical protein